MTNRELRRMAAESTAADFLILLARALHEAGQPSHLLEQTLERAAERLGLAVQAFCIPTAVLLSFEHGGGPVTRVLRQRGGGTNLEQLAEVTAIAGDVVRGDLAPDAARVRLEAVRQAPARWGAGTTVAAYVLSAAAFAVFFGGDAAELLVAVAVGLAVGLVAAYLPRARGTRSFELVAATAAGLVAGVAEWELGGAVVWVPLASGLIILLPGLSLVDAVEELASGNLASGSARLAGVGVGFLALTFGVLAGLHVADLLPVAVAVPREPLPHWVIVPALLAVAAGSTVRFRARPADVGVILTASAVALCGGRLGRWAVGEQIGPFLAAFLLAVAGNLYARWRRRPAELVVVPGLAVLVPGSVGLRSVTALLNSDAATGVETGFRMFLIAIALVAGLLAGNTLTGGRATE